MDDKNPPKDFIDALNEQEAAKKQEQDKKDQINAINKAGVKNVEATNANTESTKKTLQDGSAKVAVTNPDLAKSGDLQNVTDAIHKMNVTAFLTNDGLPKLAQGLSDFTDKVQALSNQYKDQGFTQLAKQLENAVKSLKDVSNKLDNTKIQTDSKLQKTLNDLQKSINAIDFKPTVNVAAPAAKVVTTPVDFQPVLNSLAKVEKAVNDKPEAKDIDLTPVINGLQAVQDSIANQRFPVPNYVLPFKDSNGKATQVQLDASGNVPVSGGGGGGSATVVGIGPVGQNQVAYDTVAYTNTSGTVDTYTYKTGGTGGTTTATVTIGYTDSTKTQISTVVRT